MPIDLYTRKTHNNLHNDLVKFLKEAPKKFTNNEEKDMGDLIQRLRYIVKKHSYCKKGCEQANQFFEVCLKD